MKRALASGRAVEAVSRPIGPSIQRGWTALMFAVYDANSEMVSLLLAHGANARHVDYFGRSVVHIANESRESEARIGECLALLAKAGADMNVPDQHGNSVLHIASWQGKCMVVEKLIELGADVNQADRYGCTALIDAAMHKNNACVIDTLIRHGADVNARTRSGESFLQLAEKTYYDRPELIRAWRSGRD